MPGGHDDGRGLDVHYCFINVGRAAGKIKYCMLDRSNSYIGDRYNLRAVLLRDNNTGVAVVHVLAFPNRCTGCDDVQVKTIQEIIWSLYHPKSHVTIHSLVHINGNTMDNRIDNLAERTTPSSVLHSTERLTTSFILQLIQRRADIDSPTVVEKVSSPPPPPAKAVEKATPEDIYSKCASQLVPLTHWVNVPEPIRHLTDTSESTLTQADNIVGYKKLLPCETDSGMPAYHECHYLPCTNIESRQLQYDSCGACRSVRYCSSECQLNDWPSHRQHCSLVQHLYMQSQTRDAQPHVKHSFSLNPSNNDLSLEVER